MYLNRLDAYELLLDSPLDVATLSQYSSDFFLIASGLDVQKNQAYCAVATTTAILNSLRFFRSGTDASDGVDIPKDALYAPYLYATQDDVFNQ